MNNIICENCRFWEKWKSNSEDGNCRKKSPRVMLDGYEQGCSPTTTWPDTKRVDWCGEWELRKTGKFPE